MRRSDVHAKEASELLWTSWGNDGQSCTPSSTDQFEYWQSAPGERDIERMARALDNSLVVVAAFCHIDLSKSECQDRPGESTLSMWPLHLSSVLPKAGPKTLVGMGRATGDAALTAQLYDLAVHPRMRGFGIGRQIVRMLVRQLQSKGIYDVGTICPRAVEPFFRRCQFTDDPEQSTFMAYPRNGPLSEPDPRASHGFVPLSNDGIQPLLHDAGAPHAQPSGRGVSHAARSGSSSSMFSVHVAGDGHARPGAGPGEGVDGASLQLLLRRKLEKQAAAEGRPAGDTGGGQAANYDSSTTADPAKQPLRTRGQRGCGAPAAWHYDI